jgi:two-component system, NtrC family, nitrogen regulation response regulator NtrX
MPKLLLVDDEKAIRNVVREIFQAEGFTIDDATDGFEAVNLFTANDYDVVLTDIKMPKLDGMEFLEKAQQLKPQVPIIMFSGHADIALAMDAVKKGAFDFIEKPPNLNRLLIAVRNASEKSNLVQETTTLKKQLQNNNSNSGVPNIVGNSPALNSIMEMIEAVAPSEARVLVTGENGSGKELVAKWIHAKSNRVEMPLIEVNCAAIPTELIESELFGHEKGSFTSAIKQRIGKFEQANGGTLFLDEIGDLSLSAQAKMLRALQEGKITRVGGEKEIPVDVRIIAATNKDLMQEVEDKNFRLDLYHRLSIILIKVPSLNERREDIPELVNHFLEQICNEYKKPVTAIHKDALQALQEFNWTGNIRELRNVVERLIILCPKEISLAQVKQFVTTQ